MTLEEEVKESLPDRLKRLREEEACVAIELQEAFKRYDKDKAECNRLTMKRQYLTYQIWETKKDLGMFNDN